MWPELLLLQVGRLIGVNALHLSSGEALPGRVCEGQLSNLLKTAFSIWRNHV